ncbi:unnamed protein product [Bemisia tabaci]|uniref:Uncharacterized protein n=1 Tax=Bemisia tabaci TaxID=7038 RepID=A0A9P0F2W1_BEMTA|nr:unnamed protein product [Bemisia tabaci]
MPGTFGGGFNLGLYTEPPHRVSVIDVGIGSVRSVSIDSPNHEAIAIYRTYRTYRDLPKHTETFSIHRIPKLPRYIVHTETYRTYRNLSNIPKLIEHTETYRTYRNLSNIPKVIEHTETYRTCRSLSNVSKLRIISKLPNIPKLTDTYRTKSDPSTLTGIIKNPTGLH